MTRFGKSLCVAIAIALSFIIFTNQKAIFIAPTVEQSMILRDYLANLIQACPELKSIADMSVPDEDKFRARTSRSYQTFTNGCNYRVFTAHDEADSLMGHGLGIDGGILIVDEACQIKDKAYTKIIRMLGDNPENSVLVELYNPWTRSCKAFQHSLDPDFHHIQIGYKQALLEGRANKRFIEQQRNELTPLEFTVLYESKFPAQSEDALFNLDSINQCFDGPNFDTPNLIISCDVADKGLDKTIIMIGKKHKQTHEYFIEKIYSEDRSENTQVAGKIISLMVNYRHNFEKITVFIDKIGVGTGVLSMVNEYNKAHQLGIEVVGCHFGEKAEESERFMNKKAENYFRLKDLFDNKQITIPQDKNLIKELTSISWKFSSTNKILIVDPDKSPDYADALVYFTWKDLTYTGGGYISI